MNFIQFMAKTLYKAAVLQFLYFIAVGEKGEWLMIVLLFGCIMAALSTDVEK